MCGIAGIVGNGAGNMLDELRAMVAIIAHRGPDDSGTYQSHGVLLGHNRLSVIDLSRAGRNPMFSACGRYVIVYNGEVFNFKELREELRGKYAFTTSTDTEVVLAAYVVYGRACLERLEGMFAFAIWDTAARVLFCARDHFGIKAGGDI